MDNFRSNSLSVSSSSSSSEGPMLVLAGSSFDPTDHIVLTACAGNPNYDTLKKGGTAYQVPVGYKLVLKAAKWYAINASATEIVIGSGTASVANGAAPAGAANLSYGSSQNKLLATGATAGNSAEHLLPDFEIAAGRYPYIQASQGTTGALIIGQLVAV